MIELKTCPCCGKKPQIWPMNRRWFVICESCFISTKSYGTKKEACNDWNTMKGKGEP